MYTQRRFPKTKQLTEPCKLSWQLRIVQSNSFRYYRYLSNSISWQNGKMMRNLYLCFFANLFHFCRESKFEREDTSSKRDALSNLHLAIGCWSNAPWNLFDCFAWAQSAKPPKKPFHLQTKSGYWGLQSLLQKTKWFETLKNFFQW